MLGWILPATTCLSDVSRVDFWVFSVKKCFFFECTTDVAVKPPGAA